MSIEVISTDSIEQRLFSEADGWGENGAICFEPGKLVDLIDTILEEIKRDVVYAALVQERGIDHHKSIIGRFEQRQAQLKRPSRFDEQPELNDVEPGYAPVPEDPGIEPIEDSDE